MVCPKCDASLKPTAIFCHRCGQRLVDRPPAAVSAAEREAPAASTASDDDHATQPVDHVPPPLDDQSLDQVVAAETRELPLGALGTHQRPATLAEGAVIGERYRVERVINDASPARIYEVVDLWASERCWACGAPWHDDDDDRFCEQCGAERRGKLLHLRELPLTPALMAETSDDPQAIVSGQLIYVIASARPDTAKAAEGSSDERDSEPFAHSVEVDLNAATMVLTVGPSSSGLPDAPTIEDPLLGLPDRVARSRGGLTVRVGQASDRGRARADRPNEDTALAITLRYAGEDTPPPLTLCVVADGLGGHDAGQRAGRIAARAIASHVLARLWLPSLSGQTAPPHDAVSLGETLRGGILAANDAILTVNRRESCDMGCTVTSLIAQGDAACVANVGDSRTYRFVNGALERVTIDHSLVARLVANGMLRPDDIYTHPQRSQIYRSLGDEAEVVVDLFPRRLTVGEFFVLCSDGLWEMIRDPDLARALLTFPENDPQMIAEHLVHLANNNGGDDNVTVIVAQVVC